jgi:hypothetical protein
MSWFEVDRRSTQVRLQAGSLRESSQANVPLGRACHTLAAANMVLAAGERQLFER